MSQVLLLLKKDLRRLWPLLVMFHWLKTGQFLHQSNGLRFRLQ